MSGTKRTWLTGGMLGRIPDTGPSTGDENDRVVPFRRQTLDEMEAELRSHEGRVIDAEAAMHRSALEYVGRRKALLEFRTRFAERMKEVGARIDWAVTPPAIDIDGLHAEVDPS